LNTYLNSKCSFKKSYVSFPLCDYSVYKLNIPHIHRQQNVLRNVWELKDEFTDVTLYGNDSKDGINAHKIILATASPYFRSKLKTSTEIRFDHFNKKDLRGMIELIYKGEVQVDSEEVKRFEEMLNFLSITIQERKMKQKATSVLEPLRKKQKLEPDLNLR
jgi:hypothetical protein